MLSTPEPPKPRPGWSRQKLAVCAAFSALGAVGYYFLFHRQLWDVLWPGSAHYQWYWDGFFSVLAGLTVGGNTGAWLAGRVPRIRRSDGPDILWTNCGVGIMAAVWLCLPAESAAIVGAVCRTILGGYVGCLFVVIMADLMSDEPYMRHIHKVSHSEPDMS